MPEQVTNITGVPAFHFYKDGKMIDKFEGANLNMLQDKVERLKDLEQQPIINEVVEYNTLPSSNIHEYPNEVIPIESGEAYEKLVAVGKTIAFWTGTLKYCFRNYKRTFNCLNQFFFTFNLTH
jgi:hypothetical protein